MIVKKTHALIIKATFLFLVFLCSCIFLFSCNKYDKSVKDTPSDKIREIAPTSLRESSKNNVRDMIKNEIDAEAHFQPGGIYDAIRSGDLGKVKEILDKAPEEVNSKNPDNYGRTPLHYAIIYGIPDIAEFLILKGAEIEKTDMDHGRTPLHYAAMFGDKKISEMLVSRGAKFDERDANGLTPLHYAAMHGQKAEVEYLLSLGSKIDERDDAGRTALFYGVINRHKDIVEFLISKGARVDVRDNDGKTSLHEGAIYGDREIMRILLSSGGSNSSISPETPVGKKTEIDARDDAGKTPLDYAIENDNAPVVALLKSMGAKGNMAERDTISTAMSTSELIPSPLRTTMSESDRDGKPPLHTAIIKGDMNAVIRLSKDRKNINSKDEEGMTPLHWAGIYEGSTTGRRNYPEDLWRAAGGSFIETLIAAGAEVNDRDKKGRTPLHYAVMYGNETAAKILLRRGAKINARDSEGKTPAHYCYYGNLDGRTMLKTLIAAGAGVNLRDRDGRTPLHIAFIGGRQEEAKVLLDAGADLKAKDNEGKTPLDMLKGRSWNDRELSGIYELLEKKGIKVESGKGQGESDITKNPRNSGAGERDEIPFPEILAGYRKEGESRIYSGNQLYYYIDGEADLYIQNGYEKMSIQHYSRTDHKTGKVKKVEVRVTETGAPLNAFGIFSNYTNRYGEFVPIGARGFSERNVLVFYKGNFFVHIFHTSESAAKSFGSPTTENLWQDSESSRKISSRMPEPQKDDIESDLRKIAFDLASKMPGKSIEPIELSYFPEDGMIKYTLRYHPKDMLGQSFLEKGFEARYKDYGRAFFSEFRNERETEDALKKLRTVYKDAVLIREGNFLVGVIEIKNRELARRLAEMISIKVKTGKKS